jgi:hypothetical protein
MVYQKILKKEEKIILQQAEFFPFFLLLLLMAKEYEAATNAAVCGAATKNTKRVEMFSVRLLLVRFPFSFRRLPHGNWEKVQRRSFSIAAAAVEWKGPRRRVFFVDVKEVRSASVVMSVRQFQEISVWPGARDSKSRRAPDVVYFTTPLCFSPALTLSLALKNTIQDNDTRGLFTAFFCVQARTSERASKRKERERE